MHKVDTIRSFVETRSSRLVGVLSGNILLHPTEKGGNLLEE